MRTTPIALSPLHDDMAALGWVGTGAREQLVLPLDLFMLTARSDADGRLDLQLSLLRTRPARFMSRAGGPLAFALLTPAGLLKLLRAPLHGMTERRVALASMCGAAEVHALRDAWLAAPDAAQRALQFGHWIEARMQRRHGHTSAQSRVAEAAAWLQRRHGGVPDRHALSRSLGVSARQLERDFRTWLGLLPAAYARLIRFQRAARAVADGAPLADAACAHHYCDQSHLNRGFRAFSGLTPQQLAALARPTPRRLEQQALAGRVFLLDAPRPAPDGDAWDQSPLG